MHSMLSLFSSNQIKPHTLDFTSSLPSGFTHTRNDGTIASYRDSSGNAQLAASNTAIFDHDSSGNNLGLQCFETRQNKCTNNNVSPTVTTNATASGGTFTADVDDTSALTTAKLHTLGVKVFQLDNSGGGSTVNVTFGGTTGNTNPHSFQIWARMVSGTFGSIQLSGATPGTVSFNSTSYTLVQSENITPSSTTVQMKINAAAGAVIRFTLNQLEEGKFCTPIIKIAGAAQTRANQFTQYANFNTQPWWNPSQGTIIVECRPILGTGQANAAGLLVAGSTGSSPTDAFYLQTNASSHSPDAYGKGNSNTYHISTLSYPLTGRKNSLGIVYSNGITVDGFAGPMATKNTPTAMSTAASSIVNLTIGSFAANTWQFNGWISKVWFFKKALTYRNAARYALGTKTGNSEKGIICAGQSNMEGYFSAASVLTNGGERTGVAQLNTTWGTSTRNWLINASTAGTNIAAWSDGSTAITKWKAIASAYCHAGGSIRGIIWDQGESNLGNTVSTFKTSYLAIFADMRAHLQSLGQGSVPVCIVPLGRLTDDSSSTRNTNCSYLRQAQQELASENSSYICIAPEKSLHPLVDNTHLTDAGYQLSSVLTLRKLLKFTGESISGGVDGPTITNVSRSGATLTVTITHDSGGTDFTPTSGIGGFQFYDNGTSIAISSAVRTNATTITITLASTPSGATKELWYAWGSIYNDNGSTLVRDNSSYAVPLRAKKISVS